MKWSEKDRLIKRLEEIELQETIIQSMNSHLEELEDCIRRSFRLEKYPAKVRVGKGILLSNNHIVFEGGVNNVDENSLYTRFITSSIRFDIAFSFYTNTGGLSLECETCIGGKCSSVMIGKIKASVESIFSNNKSFDLAEREIHFNLATNKWSIKENI